MTHHITDEQIAQIAEQVGLVGPASRVGDCHAASLRFARAVLAIAAPAPAPAVPSDELPEIGSLWQHTNGNVYKVLSIANEFTQDSARYPKIVVYQGVANGLVWARAASEWHRSMTLTAAPTPQVQQVPEDVARAGAALANIAFNLAQCAGQTIDAGMCLSMDTARKRWDAAIDAARKAGGAA